MADHFRLETVTKEEIVVKKHKGLYNLLYVLLWFTLLVCAIIAATNLMGLMSGNLSLPTIITTLVFGGAAWLGWWGKDLLRVEYEYSLTNGIMDIAQVINNRRRKEALSFRMRDVEILAPIDDPKLQGYEQRPGIKKIKAVLNADSTVYFLFVKKDEQHYLVYMEPSEEMVQLMRRMRDRYQGQAAARASQQVARP